MVSTGAGATVSIKLSGEPMQPAREGVTTISPEIVSVVVFAAMNEGILPVPLAPRPIAVLLFVQLKLVPATVLVNVSVPVADPLHTRMLFGMFSLGVGFTVMLKLSGAPVQPFAAAVTAMIATTGVVPLLIAVNAGTSPIPEPPRPIVVLLFVQV